MTGSLQEKNGKYFIVLNGKKDGKRKQKWIATGLDIKGNKRKATELLNETIKKYSENDLFGTRDMLFSEYMLTWLETVRNAVKENTFHEYSKVIKSDIVPYFKDKSITIKELNNLHIQEYYNHLSERMTASSVLKRHANIHKALDYAVMSGIIEKNPSDYVVLSDLDTSELDLSKGVTAFLTLRFYDTGMDEIRFCARPFAYTNCTIK
jgi:hypothetical protein